MDHAAISRILEGGLLVWVGALALVLSYRILTQRVPTRGFLNLEIQGRSTGRLAPDRVQLLAAFAVALAGYAFHALAAGPPHIDAASGLPSMPEVPQSLLVLFAGSHAIYLSGKLGRKFTR